MFEIRHDELKIMGCLVHAESLDSVISETGLDPKVVVDIIRHLRHHRYVKSVDERGKELAMFEIDKIRSVKFMLTNKGYVVLEAHTE